MAAIARSLGIVYNQVKYICTVSKQATPEYKKGRDPIFWVEQVNYTIAFI